MVRLNPRAAGSGLSPTMAAAARPSLHPDPVDLTVGEPEGPPPVEAREAAAAAALAGRTRYGPVQGLPELRARIAADLSRRDGLAWDPASVLVTAGGKPAILDALRCVLEPGDEVIIPSPHWPTFRDQVLWAGGVPVVLPPGPDLLPAPGALAAAATSRTRAVILNQPSNPTGLLWDAPRLEELADLARRRDLLVVLDQVYGTLALDGPEQPFLRAFPDLAERTLVVESFSKRFAMTGYRLGCAAGPADLVAAMTALASTSVTHASMIAQHAGIAALDLDGGWEEAVRMGLRRRRDRVLAGLEGLPGISCLRPAGAIYAFPRVAEWMAAHGVASDQALADRLRDEAGVKVLAGTPFGAPGHLRLSIAAPETALDKALARLRNFFLAAG